MSYYVSGHTSVGQPVFYCGTDEDGVPAVSTDFNKAFPFATSEAAQRTADWLEESIFCGWKVRRYIEHCAINAACELVQVAAVCEKAMEGLDEDGQAD